MKTKKTRFKYHYLIRMPMTEAVTFEEGGDWVSFESLKGGPWRSKDNRLVHSIRFVGGHEWDAFNGWRNTEFSSTAGRNLTCRDSKLRDAPESYNRIEEVPDDFPKPPPDEMIARMARAIAETYESEIPPLERSMGKAVQAAKAAIRVMREPTERMIIAAVVQTNRFRKSKGQHAGDCWQSMIDGALREAISE